MWTIYNSDVQNRCLALTRRTSCYQRAILRGEQPMSGSTLRGKARIWKIRYHRSAYALLARMTAAGIPWSIRRIGQRNILVIG